MAYTGYGKNVMLAYGGGSVKKNGIYDELKTILKNAGKTVTDFSGIMSNPTYAKVQEGAKLAKEQKIDFILAVGGGSQVCHSGPGVHHVPAAYAGDFRSL